MCNPTKRSHIMINPREQEMKEAEYSRQDQQDIRGDRIASKISSSVHPTNHKKELSAYYHLPAVPMVEETSDSGQNVDPLEWWLSQTGFSPSRQDGASLSGGYSNSEHVFSRGGNIVTKKLASLCKNTSMLMFIACNRHHRCRERNKNTGNRSCQNQYANPVSFF